MTTATAPPDERLKEAGRLGRLRARPELGAILALAVVWLFFAVVAWDNQFVSWATTAAILNRAAPLGIIAVAVALLMIAGEFDLSVGSIIGFGGMTIMLLVSPAAVGGFAWPLGPAILVALVVTVAAGLLNGILVQATLLPSFIITLAALFVFRGLAIAVPRTVTNRTQLGGFADIPGADVVVTLFGSSITVFGARFNVSILWWAAFVLIGTWILTRTRIGNWIFGAGGDPVAARNVGVPVTTLKIALFMTTALAAFFVAFMQVAQFGTADSLRGTLFEFQAIIACVVGGVLLRGGYGTVVGATAGALTFAMVQQGIIITGVDGDWFQVFVGAILVLAVIFNEYIRRMTHRR